MPHVVRLMRDRIIELIPCVALAVGVVGVGQIRPAALGRGEVLGGGLVGRVDIAIARDGEPGNAVRLVARLLDLLAAPGSVDQRDDVVAPVLAAHEPDIV